MARSTTPEHERKGARRAETTEPPALGAIMVNVITNQTATVDVIAMLPNSTHSKASPKIEMSTYSAHPL